ncbi:MAG: hypothetical protein ACI91T_001784, partial [Natronomonas sp.]
MKRALALAMIALLAVPASAAVGSPDAWVADGTTEAIGSTVSVTAENGSATNHTNVTRTRLELLDDPKHDAIRPSLDLGTAIATDDAQLESAYQIRVDQRRIFSASNADDLIERFADRIEARIDALRTQQRAATRAYASGEISDREFASQFVLIASEVDHLTEELQTLREAASRRETILRIESLEFRLRSFSGRAHDELERGLRGGEASLVSIAATQDGYVLRLLNRSEGTFYRQALRFDNRNPNGTPSLETTDEAFDRLQTLYSETTTDEVFIRSFDAAPVQRARDAGPYEAVISYPEGYVTLYLDAATESVFYEERRLQFERMPRTTVLNETIDGVRLVVERTHDNGPTLVRATDADTGEP